ncbi:MAG: hypothetical protein JNM74_22585 [Myxococcales bacterium]|nr:hypothetical protein [Myxococcales bacterium]
MSRLDEALRALREDVDGASPDAPRTLARVLARTEVTRRRTRFLAYFAAAAALVVTAAWAAVPSAPRRAEAPTESAPVVPVSSGAMRPAPSASAEDVSPQASATALSAPSSAPAPSSALAPPSAEARPVPSGRRDEAARDSAELAAYEQAHRAHFVEKDASSALRAWDGYLTSYPRGSFAPEASYNRAICLLRLHREAEAKKALEPFARGAYGSYRQKEAQLLLAGLADAGH